MVTGIEFRGREVRSILDCSASNICYRQVLGKVRTVDCTLDSFRSMAREADVIVEDAVSFIPSKFDVLAYNKRRNESVAIQFESFESICETMRLR